MKPKKDHSTFDVESVQERLKIEYEYIINLFSRMPELNLHGTSDDQIEAFDQGEKPVKLFENRGQTSEEFHKKKLNEFKGKWVKNKDNIMKRLLKSKLNNMPAKTKDHKKNPNLDDHKTESNQESIAPVEPILNNDGKVVFSRFDLSENGNVRQIKKTTGNPTGTKTECNKIDPNLNEHQIETNQEPTTAVEPVFNSEKNVFSRFDLGDYENPRHKKKQKKNPVVLLRELEKQEKKDKKLIEEGKTDILKEIKEERLWDASLKRASGLNVKDNLSMLKKTIKKKFKRKEKSCRVWAERIKQTEKKMEKRQMKRTKNIEEKIQRKKDHKKKQLVKRGRIFPDML